MEVYRRFFMFMLTFITSAVVLFYKKIRLVFMTRIIEEKWRRQEDRLKLKINLRDAHACERIAEKKNRTAYVGGITISFSKEQPNEGWIALAVVKLSNLQVVYTQAKQIQTNVDYIPGFQAFQEAPLIIEFLQNMKAERNCFYPDILMVDGNGILHPRDFGLACHVGIGLNIPCIGVAKSLFICHGIGHIQEYREMVESLRKKGEGFILHSSPDRKPIAKCLRSAQDSKNPIYVSQGYKISLKTAVWIVLRLCIQRVPEPIRVAGQISRRMMQQHDNGNT